MVSQNVYEPIMVQNSSQRSTNNYSEPGKPMQNGYVERFNRTFREDILDAYLFSSVNQFQVIADKIIEDYNDNHPHESLGGKSPREYGNRKNTVGLSPQYSEY